MDALIYKDTIYGGGGAMRGNYFNPIIYSEEEREVGVWIDDKPLYQKTIPITKTSTATLVDISSLDIDTLVDCTGVEYPNDKSFFLTLNYHENSNWYCFLEVVGTDLGVYCSDRDYNRTPNVLATIQYTKTSDVAGSGKYNTLGVPNEHYTTDEQIIGTWVDGKPLYEKTFTGLSQATNGADWVTVQGVNIPSIKDLINTTAWASGGGGEQIKMALAECSAVSEGVRVTVISSAWNRTINKMTVQYTKTTD